MRVTQERTRDSLPNEEHEPEKETSNEIRGSNCSTYVPERGISAFILDSTNLPQFPQEIQSLVFMMFYCTIVEKLSMDNAVNSPAKKTQKPKIYAKLSVVGC